MIEETLRAYIENWIKLKEMEHARGTKREKERDKTLEWESCVKHGDERFYIHCFAPRLNVHL